MNANTISLEYEKSELYSKSSPFISSISGYKFMSKYVFPEMGINFPELIEDDNRFTISGYVDDFKSVLEYILNYKIVKINEKDRPCPVFYENLPIDENIKTFFGIKESYRTNPGSFNSLYVNHTKFIDDTIKYISKNIKIKISSNLLPGMILYRDGQEHKEDSKYRFLLLFWKFVSIPFNLSLINPTTNKFDFKGTNYCVFAPINVNDFADNFHDLLTNLNTEINQSGTPKIFQIYSEEESLLKSSNLILNRISSMGDSVNMEYCNIPWVESYQFSKMGKAQSLDDYRRFNINVRKVLQYKTIEKEYINKEFKTFLIKNLFYNRDLLYGFKKFISSKSIKDILKMSSDCKKYAMMME